MTSEMVDMAAVSKRVDASWREARGEYVLRATRRGEETMGRSLNMIWVVAAMCVRRLRCDEVDNESGINKPRDMNGRIEWIYTTSRPV